MENKSKKQEIDSSANAGKNQANNTEDNLLRINSDKDGRNKEWEDRARVNTEVVPEGTKTNIERDWEPEKLNEKQKDNKDNY